MQQRGDKSQWAQFILAIVLATISSTALGNASGPSPASIAERPDPAMAQAFLEEWLSAKGFPCPGFEVSDTGIPKGADAATFCKAKVCTIRIRPDALSVAISTTRREGSPWRQWQNLLLHEALHFIDVQRRGKSDHGGEFKALVREFDVAYLRH